MSSSADFGSYSAKYKAFKEAKGEHCSRVEIDTIDHRTIVHLVDLRDGGIGASCILDRQGRFSEEIKSSAYRNIRVLRP